MKNILNVILGISPIYECQVLSALGFIFLLAIFVFGFLIVCAVFLNLMKPLLSREEVIEYIKNKIEIIIPENGENNQEQSAQTNEEPTINPDLVIQREPEMIKENKDVPETKQILKVKNRNDQKF